MAFPLRDVRFTSRRGGGSDPTLFPRLLRDRSILPKVDIAIQYFETMLGRERRDFETEVLVHFFGDHKLARCMVACLARSYRFRSPPLAEVVTRGGLRRLSQAGIDSPRGLRFRVFDQVNDFGHGFLPGNEREATFGRLETELALRPGELERLLDLDSEERTLLMRVGAEPKPADVVAQYNFGVLESLLRHAAWIQLRLSEATPEAAAGIAQLCRVNDVDAELQRVGGNLQVRLAGRQDALGVWARHGRRVARSLVQALERGRATAVDGEAEVAIRDRRARLRLTPEALDFLGGAPATSFGWGVADGWDEAAVSETTEALRGRRLGWTVRRMPDAQAWTNGVIVPDLLVQTEAERRLVCIVRSASQGARLASIARAATTGEPYVFIGCPAATEPLRAVAARAASARRCDPASFVGALRHVLDSPESVGMAQSA